jgi:glycosyltransferase involved in cell wall biosynthesis
LKKKNVLVVCGAGIVSGKEIMTLQLLNSLKERGHDCYCITSDWGSDDFKKRLKDIDIPYSSIRIGFISKTFSWRAIRMTLHQGLYVPWMLMRYLSIVRKQKPDVVIHTNFHHLFLLYPVVRTTCRNIYWSHEFMGASEFYKKLFTLFNKKITTFVGVSEAVASSMRIFIEEKKVRVIHNGISAPRGFERKKERKPYPVIGIVGQITEHKGHKVLFNALKDFRSWRFRPSVQVVGSGDASYIGELNTLAKDLQVDEIIEWKGFVRDANEIYREIDILVVPTQLPDPYPTVVMEAGFRGIPVIVSDSGGLPEMVDPNVNGKIFRTGNDQSLATCLSALPDQQEYKTWSEVVTLNAQKQFALKTFVDKFETLITE